MKILAGARSSPLSRAQVEELLGEIRVFYPELDLEMSWVITKGDREKTVSLRTLGKDDFFTRELDQMLLAKEIRIAIHSAKDLPEPIPEGLSIIAITRGVDSRDSLVLPEGKTLQTLPPGAVIATSSVRREETVRALRPDLHFIDLRGTIGERLEKMINGEADGVVVAEAALIRLRLTHLNRVFLPGETVPYQGRLAVLARTEDREMHDLFSVIHEDTLSRA